MAKIYLYGDTHGTIEIHKLDKLDGTYKEGDFIIICGDFGVIWDNAPNKAEKAIVKFLDNLPCETLFVDGNHENFNRINALPSEQRFGGNVGRYSEKVFHLKRGEIYKLHSKNFFTMGGALSIDKHWRVKNKSWWEGEAITNSELEYGLKNIVNFGENIDYVITHTIPQSAVHKIAHFMNIDHKIMDENPKKLEQILALLEQKHSVKAWFFGHWHKDFGFKIKNCEIDFNMLYNEVAILDESGEITRERLF